MIIPNCPRFDTSIPDRNMGPPPAAGLLPPAPKTAISSPDTPNPGMRRSPRIPQDRLPARFHQEVATQTEDDRPQEDPRPEQISLSPAPVRNTPTGTASTRSRPTRMCQSPAPSCDHKLAVDQLPGRKFMHNCLSYGSDAGGSDAGRTGEAGSRAGARVADGGRSEWDSCLGRGSSCGQSPSVCVATA
jgi:hypothetical protein